MELISCLGELNKIFIQILAMYSFSQNVLNHQLLHILTNLLLYVPGIKV